MSRDLNGSVEFERQLRTLLHEGVQRVGGRARSRLNQARHAALAEAARPRRRWHLPLWLAALAARPLGWLPATIAAVVLMGLVLWPRSQPTYPAVEASHATVADLDLLADRDGMALMQAGDGRFYEWAMAQAEADPSAQPAGGTQGAHRAPSGRGPAAGQNPDQNSG